MREIKFRAWDFGKKKMYSVDAIYFQNMLKSTGYNITINRKDCPVLSTGFERFELMQYTGLKDRFGKEIYEGDILKSGVKPWIVKWSAPCFKMFREGYKPYGDEAFIHERVEIIGNIYENRNLPTKNS